MTEKEETLGVKEKQRGMVQSETHKEAEIEAVVVSQLSEQLLAIPEVRGSNSVIGKFLLNICLLST